MADEILSVAPKRKTEPFALVSFCLFIACIPLFVGTAIIFFFSTVIGIMLELSIAFGVLALVKIKYNPELKGRTLAVISIVFSVLFLALILFAAFSYSPPRYRGDPGLLEPDPYPADVASPITISPELIVKSAGQTAIMKVSVLNNMQNSANFSINIICNDESVIADQQSQTIQINSKESKLFTVLLKMGKVPKNSYLCSITAMNSLSNESGYTKDFGVDII